MKKKWKFRLQPKLVLGLINMAVLLSVVLASSIAQAYKGRMEKLYSSLAFGQASIVASFVDGDKVEEYYQTGVKDEYYENVQKYLTSIQRRMSLKYVYVVVPEEDVMVYIWDAGVQRVNGVCGLGDTDAYYGDGYEVMHSAFSSSNSEQTILITENETYGYLASAYVPIYNSEGDPVALASVDVSMDMINKQINQFLLLTICPTLAILPISIFAYYSYIKKILIRPLGKLHQATQELVQDNMEDLSSFKIDVHTGDELEDLSNSFQFMVSELNEYILNLSKVTAEKERIGAELNLAKNIQASMLPCIFPAFPKRSEFDIYASMNPAKEVGGDFYDFFLVDDDHLALIIADVSGKGVPAALFMMISKTLLKSAVQSGLSPKEVLTKVNNQLYETNEADMFVTVWLGILEISTGIMKCANAGHEYPAIMRAGQDFELFKDHHDFVLAAMEAIRYHEYELKLEAGDRLFVYTDGVMEATDSSDTMYGSERTLRALNAAKGGTCHQLLDALHQDINEFVGEAAQFDDITMLCIEMKPMAFDMKKTSIVPTLENLPEATEFFENILTGAGASTKIISQTSIVVDEVFSNIVQYSGATVATLGCALTDQKLTLRFADNGQPYDPTEKPDPDITLSAEEREIGGLGIFMVKQLMKDISYEYSDGMNILTLSRDLA